MALTSESRRPHPPHPLTVVMRILAVSLLLGVCFWVFDGIFQYHTFHEDLRFLILEGPQTLTESLVTKVPFRDLVIREIFLVLCLVAGGIAAFFAYRQLRTQASLLEEITEREKAQAAMQQYHNKLKQMGSELGLIEERERRSLALDLHDNIGQSLAVARLKINMLKAETGQAGDRERLGEVVALIDEMSWRIRVLTFNLSPPILFELGLAPALDWLCEEMSRVHEVAFGFSTADNAGPVAPDLGIVLFRSTRELMMNVVKHAGVKKASVTMQREDGRLAITVEDMGGGFDALELDDRPDHPSFGLFSIRERLTSLGGELLIDSRPEEGVRATLVAPLEASAAGEGGVWDRKPPNRVPAGDAQ